MADQRQILRAYAEAKAGILAPAMEIVISGSSQARDVALGPLAGVGGVARDIAAELSFTDGPPDPTSFKPFVNYCIARGRFREAVDFAEMADPAGLGPFARATAEAAAERVAFDAVKHVDRDLARSIDMTALAAERVRCLSVPRATVTREPGIVGAVAISSGPTVLKAPAICSAGRFRVRGGGQPGRSGRRFALAVCEPGARIEWVKDRVAPREGVWLSDWTRPPGDGAAVKARVSLDRAPDHPLDVFVLGVGEGGAGRLTWRRASAEVSVFDLAAPRDIEPDVSSWSLPRPALERAELLTPASDFPVPYFAPGDPTMHHPLAGRAAVVRLRGAIFPGAAGVSAIARFRTRRRARSSSRCGRGERASPRSTRRRRRDRSLRAVGRRSARRFSNGGSGSSCPSPRTNRWTSISRPESSNFPTSTGVTPRGMTFR